LPVKVEGEWAAEVYDRCSAHVWFEGRLINTMYWWDPPRFHHRARLVAWTPPVSWLTPQARVSPEKCLECIRLSAWFNCVISKSTKEWADRDARLLMEHRYEQHRVRV